MGDAGVNGVLLAVHRGDKGKCRLAGVVGIRHNGDTAGEDAVVLELGGIRAALHPNLHPLQAADILLRGIRRSLRVVAIALHVDHQRGKHPCGHPLPHGGVIAHLNFQIVRGLAGIHDVGDARVGAVLRAVHRGDKGKGRLTGVVGIRHNGDTAGEDTVVLELGGIRAALHPDLHLLQAADILLCGIRRSLRMLAVTFHQNDNIRESAIQLPLVVDILQSKSCVGVPLQPCLFVRFFGVRIVLVLVSGQIELDDGLQNTVIHVGRRVAQVKAAGDPPVCLAVAGCFALDGDKVCGNVEPRKIILCNGGDDGEGLEGGVLVIALAGDGHLAALLR